MSFYKPPIGAGGGGGTTWSGIVVLSGQYQVSGFYQLSGAGAGNSGSSFVGGIAQFSGNGSGTTYVITHGLGTTPTKFTAIPNSLDAMGDYRVEASGNTLSVIYTTARPSGASNISIDWMADSQVVSGGVLGSNILVGGAAVFSGNTSGTTFLINHNIGVTPSRYGVVPSTVDAVGDYRVEASGNTLSVIYTAARASGDSNIGLVWFADTNNVSGGPANPLNVGALNVSGTATLNGSLVFASGASGIAFSGLQLLPAFTPPDFVIWQSGSVYRAVRTVDGRIVSSGATPNTVFESIISGKQDIKVAVLDGTYTFAAGFSGINIARNITLELNKSAILQVPNGYDGALFDVACIPPKSNVRGVHIEGGFLDEVSGTGTGGRQRLWDAIRLTADSGRAVYDSTFTDMRIEGANNAINFSVIAAGASPFIDAVNFRDMWLENCVQFINMSGSRHQAVRNVFDGLGCQSISGITQYGATIQGTDNEFYGVKFWDMGNYNLANQSGYSAYICSGANSTLIKGGIMTNVNFVDEGIGTKAEDEFVGLYQGTSGYIQVQGGLAAMGMIASVSGVVRGVRFIPHSGSNTIDMTFETSGGSQNIQMRPNVDGSAIALSLYNRALNERMFTQRATPGNNNYNVTIQRVSNSGVIRPFRFNILDSVATTTIEPYRINESGDVTFNTSGGSVTAKGLTVQSGLTANNIKYGSFLGSGNAATTIYTVSHGIINPVSWFVTPASPLARGDYDVSGASGQLMVTYPVAPASGDIRLVWGVFA